ncbi:MAG: UbiA family prenyltransferase [Candidatus Thermoplasmatota archaeon]|nr:UbiA family prenyltransferase [Candidatus Thermoplasmatota archaeon]
MKSYLKLIRPYGMLFLGFTPVFGAIANNELSFSRLAVLFIIGLLTHIFGFVQNDYYDVEIDGKSKYVSSRPLTAGYISKKTAFFIFTSSFIISLILALVFLFSFVSFLFLLFSFLCMGFYNKYSKRLFGMEYILSIGVFTLGIFGALTVSNSISSLAIIVSALGFMQWLFSVGISANLKDVEFDSKLGIRTTPTVFGVHASDKKLFIPLSFGLYAFTIKFIHIIIAALPFLLGYTSIFIYDLPIPGICFIIISIILFYLTFKILSIPIKERDKMLIYAGLQEGLALLLIPVALMSFLTEKISLLATFLLILLFIFWPIFWFRFLFGKRMIPLE